jgi:hypothetical protein
MSRQTTCCNAQVLLPRVCGRRNRTAAHRLSTLLQEVNAKMEHTKKLRPVVGLIILIVLGYLVYHVAYLAIQ